MSGFKATPTASLNCKASPSQTRLNIPSQPHHFNCNLCPHANYSGISKSDWPKILVSTCSKMIPEDYFLSFINCAHIDKTFAKIPATWTQTKPIFSIVSSTATNPTQTLKAHMNICRTTTRQSLSFHSKLPRYFPPTPAQFHSFSLYSFV